MLANDALQPSCCDAKPPSVYWSPSDNAMRCQSCTSLWTPYLESVDAAERQTIARALIWSQGKILAAAARLGISRHALRRRMEKFDMEIK